MVKYKPVKQEVSINSDSSTDEVSEYSLHLLTVATVQMKMKFFLLIFLSIEIICSQERFVWVKVHLELV